MELKWNLKQTPIYPKFWHYNFCITYLLTHSMVQIPSWEVNWFVASQEIPRISRNPKVHYRTHKRWPPVSILGQRNPVHIPTSHLLEIHPNIIQSSTPRSPHWSHPSGFPSKNIYTPLSLPIRATCPAHLITISAVANIFIEPQHSCTWNKCWHFLQNMSVAQKSHKTPSHFV
jgi:hypothetical protein